MIEIFGWIFLMILIAQCILNFAILFYTSWLGRFLGLNTNLRKCGPWAGIFNKLKCISFNIIIPYNIFEFKLSLVLQTESGNVSPKG